MKLCIAALLLLSSSLASAGAGVIAVVKEGGKLCASDQPEYRVLRVSPEVAVQNLNHWLAGEPLAQEEFAWAFSGYIKFCGSEERLHYFSSLIEALKNPKNEKPYVLCLIHCKAPELLEMVESEIAKKPAVPFLQNLEKAKRLIEHQKKNPVPYPTEKTVRQIEKRSKK